MEFSKIHFLQQTNSRDNQPGLETTLNTECFRLDHYLRRVSSCILFYGLNFGALLQLSLLFPLTIFLARYVQKKTLV